MLEEKIKGKLTKTIIEPARALKESGVAGRVLSLVASWHRTVENGKETVDMAEFDFLVASGGKPIQVRVSYENGTFQTETNDLSSEIGDVSEEEQFLSGVKLLSDAAALQSLEEDRRIQETMRKARHLRVFSLSFVIYDDEFNSPVWKVELKNWPLTNFYKREKPVTVEAVVSAVNGRILHLQKVI